MQHLVESICWHVVYNYYLREFYEYYDGYRNFIK